MTSFQIQIIKLTYMTFFILFLLCCRYYGE